MATVDLTSRYRDFEATDKLTPNWDQVRYPYRFTDPNLDYRYRGFSPKRKATMPSDWYHRFTVSPPISEHNPPRVHSLPVPSTPQFSGTIFPAGAREGFICSLDAGDNSKKRTVLEPVQIDASGNFASKGYYPVRPNGEYYLFVEGDDTYESKDFRLNSPVEHQPQYTKDPNLGAVHNAYDSAANLRTLLIHDQFTGSQGASLNGRAPDTVSPGNWVANGVNVGAHADGGNNFVAYTLGSGSTAAIDVGASNVLMHMDFVFGDSTIVNSQAGFIVRWLNSLNFLLVSLTGAGTATPYLQFTEYVNGTPSIVNLRMLMYMNTLNVDQYYQWKLLALNDQILYQFSDGKKIWSDRVIHYTRYQNNTMHGFLINAQQYVDNFKIWTA